MSAAVGVVGAGPASGASDARLSPDRAGRPERFPRRGDDGDPGPAASAFPAGVVPRAFPRVAQIVNPAVQAASQLRAAGPPRLTVLEAHERLRAGAETPAAPLEPAAQSRRSGSAETSHSRASTDDSGSAGMPLDRGSTRPAASPLPPRAEEHLPSPQAVPDRAAASEPVRFAAGRRAQAADGPAAVVRAGSSPDRTLLPSARVEVSWPQSGPRADGMSGGRVMGVGGLEGHAASARTAPRTHPARSFALASDVPSRVHGQIFRGVVAALRQGGGTATLRLNPESLGELRIRLEVYEGRVRARFEVAREPARELLDRALPGLRAALEAQGLEVERLAVHLVARHERATGEACEPRTHERQEPAGREADPEHEHAGGASQQSSEQGRDAACQDGRPDGDASGAESVAWWPVATRHRADVALYHGLGGTVGSEAPGLRVSGCATLDVVV